MFKQHRPFQSLVEPAFLPVEPFPHISTMGQPPQTFGRPSRGRTIGGGAASAGTVAGAIATAIAAGWGLDLVERSSACKLVVVDHLLGHNTHNTDQNDENKRAPCSNQIWQWKIHHLSLIFLQKKSINRGFSSAMFDWRVTTMIRDKVALNNLE